MAEPTGLKILLVDDLPGNLLAMESLLRQPGLEIYKADSGRQALELLLNHEFALALLDVQMPEMDGFELAELMRGTDRTRAVPIIFVTAGAHSAMSTFRGYDSGAVDFLHKPVDPYIVKSKVQVFLDLARKGQVIQAQLQETRNALSERDNALAEAREALQLRDEFLSIASHELKTPLTGLILQLQLMIRQIQKVKAGEGKKETVESYVERTDRALAVAVQQSKKLSDLIDELLDLTRIRLGRLTLNLEEFNLGQLASDCMERILVNGTHRGPEVKFHCPEEVRGFWDPLRIEQVLTNLLSNSVKYGEGKPVQMEILKDGAHSVKITVVDHGLGIAPEMQSKIFQRFERAEAVNHFSGLGLGLYITRQIVEAHGGSISVVSELGQGSTFTVHLPLRSQSTGA